MTTPSPEALAQAREQQVKERGSREGLYLGMWLAETWTRERATVIELRRQLADMTRIAEDNDRSYCVARDALESERETTKAFRHSEWKLRAELATERQRAEAAERDYAAALKQLDYAAHRIGKGTTELEASEAKRKALREACEAIEKMLRGNGTWPACTVYAWARDVLAADGKDDT
jgi:hypothetical protein